jgi:hypothetical protein
MAGSLKNRECGPGWPGKKVIPPPSLKSTRRKRFQDGSEREEAESMPPEVKSWRDPGDTPYRKNH